MATDEVMRWQGRVFLPVLHAAGKVQAVGDRRVQNMSALVMEKAERACPSDVGLGRRNLTSRKVQTSAWTPKFAASDGSALWKCLGQI
eukprot:1045952-Amphidinium_carterae.1